jgi:hypothetical protein
MIVSFKNYFSGSFFYMISIKKYLPPTLIVILLSFFISGCLVYEPLKIQVLSPAKKEIAPEVYKVILINHSVINQTKKGFQSNVGDFDSISSNQYLEGLIQVLQNTPRYKVVNYPYLFKKKGSKADRFKKLSWDEVTSICKDSAADGIIALENYQVTYTEPVKMNFSSEYGYYASLRVENNALWKIYNLRSKVISDDFIVQDTLYWNANGSVTAEIINKMPEISDAVMQSCYLAGSKYGERIAQTWVTEKRYILSCEISDFITASGYAKQGDWLKAIDLWKKYTYGNKKRLSAIATYNMAVACETLDNLDAALEWAAKSYFIRKDEYSEIYISMLEKRKQEKEIIEKQLK